MLITTERLILRSFQKSDAEDVFEYLKEPTVHCFYDMKLADLEAARKAVAERMDDEFYLAIVLKTTGKVIGELFGHPESTDPTQEDCDTFSPCWMLHPDYQGKGYMYEAARRLQVSPKTFHKWVCEEKKWKFCNHPIIDTI